jgi:nucleoside-diphosphate-sugar epimerase
MSRFAVTGAAGFIGANLCEGLLAAGHEVVGIDNFLTGKKENLDGLSGGFSFVACDIRDGVRLTPLLEGCDYVLHHAAMASVPWSVEEPALAHSHNVTGTFNVLQAARQCGVKKVVMAVTSAVYGDTTALPVHEDLPPSPLSPYATTKLMGEQYLQMFHRVYGLPCVGLRYFNVFGRRQDPASAYAAAIPIFVKKVLSDQPPVIFGDGTQTRDFVYIDDVVAANLLACEAGSACSGEMFNIGTGKGIAVTAVCERIIALLQRKVVPVHVAERPGDIRHSLADISKARRMLGFAPEDDVLSGLDKAIAWYAEHLA